MPTVTQVRFGLFSSVLVASLLSACQLTPTPPQPAAESLLASKQPYAPAQDSSTYQAVPSGYQPVFTQLVSRHGSRTMTSAKYADLVLQLWQQAQSEGALTSVGANLGADLQGIEAASVKLGYGNLTQLGGEEQQALATRLGKRMNALLTQAAAAGQHVSVLNSGKDRAVDSSVIFAKSLQTAYPTLTIDAPVANAALLYFHKATANKNYQDYLAGDTRLLNTLAAINYQQKSHDVARDVLLKLFTPAFVDKLSAGKYTFTFKDDGTTLKDDIDAVSDLYAVYSILPAMKYEGNWNFTPYLPDADAQWLAYLSDAADFYQKGPSFSDRNITYNMAKVLADDFFTSLSDVATGKSTMAARLRFTHAEIVIPFAAYMQLPGSEQPTSAATLYTYDNNPWRGATVSPLSANIQWDAYKNASGSVIVRMLYNEKETRFKADCNSISAGSYFYDFAELKRCYGY